MGHTHSEILVHVVFGTKGRQRTIHDQLRPRLWDYMGGIARQEFAGVLKVGGTDDHTHGLLRLRPDMSVAEAMAKWKSLSSGWVHREFPECRAFAWQSRYGAFSVSPGRKDGVVSYIENQAEHHRTMTFQEEFVSLLARAGISYDPKYLWADD